MKKEFSEKVEEMSGVIRLGIQSVDLQHEKFYKLLEELRLYAYIQEDEIHFRSILTELEEYAVYHFINEERLMRENNYPEYEEHLIQHQLFSQKLQEFGNALDYGNRLVSQQMVMFFQRWFVHHVCGLDKLAIEYVLQNKNDDE